VHQFVEFVSTDFLPELKRFDSVEELAKYALRSPEEGVRMLQFYDRTILLAYLFDKPTFRSYESQWPESRLSFRLKNNDLNTVGKNIEVLFDAIEKHE
jgi:hypothetical protein